MVYGSKFSLLLSELKDLKKTGAQKIYLTHTSGSKTPGVMYSIL